MQKPKILCIGGGWVTNTRHIPALRESGLFDVCGVVSKDSDRAVKTSEKYHLPNYGTNLDLRSGWQSDAQAVMIGTVPQVHAEIIETALEADKHVLCEKPMVLNPAEASRLANLAEERKLTLAVVHHFQFAGCAERFRRKMEQGKLGKIKAVYGVQLCNRKRNIPDWCDQLPLGLFFDEAPHFYYLFRWLAPQGMDLLHANIWDSKEKTRNTPRLVTAEYRAKDDFPVHLHVNFESSITEWHVTVVTEKAVVDMDVWRDIFVVLPDDGAHSAAQIMRTSLEASVQHWAGVIKGGVRYIAGKHLYGNVEVVNRFFRAINGENSLKGMDAEEGRLVVEHMQEINSKAGRIG